MNEKTEKEQEEESSKGKFLSDSKKKLPMTHSRLQLQSSEPI